MAPSAAHRAAPSSPIGAVLGPTGSGKTDLSLALAGRVSVEILIADSRQVYRGMDIGTAKPDAAARASATHHLVDLVDVGEPFTVADWVAEARRLIPEITARGHLPLLVGGSGLQVDALLEGYAFDLPSQPERRARLSADLAAAGVGALASRLHELDPAAAGRIDLRNPRRVTRALERLAAGGGGGAPTPGARPWPGRVARIGISRPREVLYRRIDERAAWLFAHGLLDEVQRLLAAGHDPRRAPLTSHGYSEAAHYLAGEWSLDEAVAMTARRTRQYAKRQMTWFGRDRRIVWIVAGDLPGDDPGLVEEADRLLRALLS